MMNGEFYELRELGREPVDYWRITRTGAGAGIDAPCPAGRYLVNLVKYCAARISVRVRGRLNLVDFSPAAKAWRWAFVSSLGMAEGDCESWVRGR